MWHWQSKGVRDAIPGLCSQEGRVELPGEVCAVGGWAGWTSDLNPQGMADGESFPEQ